jgi:prefoldin subunit 2
LVLSTLDQTLAEDPDRKCFRLIGGVLVERTVRDITPALKTNRDGVRRSFNYLSKTLLTFSKILKVIATLAEQYTTKEKDLDSFKREYNIRLVQ